MAKYKNKQKSSVAHSQEWQEAIASNDTEKMQKLIVSGAKASKGDLYSVKDNPKLYGLVFSGMTGNTPSKKIDKETIAAAITVLKNKNEGNTPKGHAKPRKGYAIKVSGKDFIKTFRAMEISRAWLERKRVF